MATVDEILATMNDDTIVYDDDYPAQYVIDNDFRIISVPADGVVLGVEHDKDVNYVKFVMPRYYKKQDLSGFKIRIIFENAGGTVGFYTVSSAEINEDTIEFGWRLSYDVTQYKGTVDFAVRLYTLLEGTTDDEAYDEYGRIDSAYIDQAFDTTIGNATVLEGMEYCGGYTPSQVEDMLAKLEKYADEVVGAAADKLTTKVDDKLTEVDAAEATRVSNESTRVSNENSRKTAETSRAEAETLRASNETTRISNENDRVAAEATRVSEYDEIIKKTNDAINTANDAAEKAISAAMNIDNIRIGLLRYDSTTGTYDNESVRQFFNSQKNGRIYGVRKYKTGVTTMTKLGANSGIDNPTPGTIATAAVNPYTQERSIFAWYNCNGDADADGNPIMYCFEGDPNFKLAHPTYDTCTARMPIYYRQEETDEYIDNWYSDSPHEGFQIEDAAILPDGSIRPYILMAKYALSYDGTKYRSTSGQNVRIRDISHNSLITKVGMSTGGGAISYADVWYIHAMFDLMFADYDTQKYLAGCASYSTGCAPTVAETGVKRVIIPTSTANNLIVGSCMMLGTNTNHDRYYCYEVFDGANITSIEKYDDSNSAVYVDTEDTFDTTTSMYFQTRPWRCGCTDTIVGGLGSPTNNTSSKEPFVFQGLELEMGMYEISGDLVAKSVGEGFIPYKLLDQTKATASAPTDDYQALDVTYAVATDSWNYPKYSMIYDGVSLAGPTFGASTTTGICDGYYLNKMTATGSREFLLFGRLGVGAHTGLRCVNLYGGLGYTGWYLGSRRSFVGRKGVNSA